jgi:hypothetical protein
VPRIPDLELHALWRDRVRRQADSGLTIAQFCARERLSMASFQAWKRRLRLIDLADRHPAVAAPPTFLPVTVRIPERAPGEPLAIEADFPNGVRLRIPTTNVRLACCLVRLVARAKTDSGGSRC